MTEETTTSSGRIFIKILFQDISENLGLRALNARLQKEEIKPYIAVRRKQNERANREEMKGGGKSRERGVPQKGSCFACLVDPYGEAGLSIGARVGARVYL